MLRMGWGGSGKAACYLNLEGGNPNARFTDRENAAGSLKCISSDTCLMVIFESWSIWTAWFIRNCQRYS